MARLNEPSVSSDSLETLRRRLLRQNRDLAKSNNLRALKIRELENNCACMLSENIQLRGRIFELEKQAEDSEARRIADHALAIKAQLESQLMQWGELISGLGLEPPPKRHSPSIGRTTTTTTRRRTSFTYTKLSPSQRRLRDVAKDVEQLGHISEYKSYSSRRSMNPDEILALRSEADISGSPELGPPPQLSEFVTEGEPTKIDSPAAVSPVRKMDLSPGKLLEPPVSLPSPQADRSLESSPSPVKAARPSDIRAQDGAADEAITNVEDTKPRKAAAFQEMLATPTKNAKKRKLATRDEASMTKPAPSMAQENQPPRVIAGKPSIREKTGGKTLKELTNLRKESQEQSIAPRKALAAKSTNDDVSSPRKATKPIKQPAKEDVVATKPTVAKANNPTGRPRGRPRINPVKIEPEPTIETPAVATVVEKVENDLGKPLAEPELLSPSSPEAIQSIEDHRGDTPPPADISYGGDASRPSRRNRTAVSYAEPNLRDKMRRPTKELVDAVVERRSSQLDLVSRESINMKQSDSDMPEESEPGSIPASPLAKKAAAAEFDKTSKPVDRRKRSSVVAGKSPEIADDQAASHEVSSESVSTDVDVYDITDTSPQPKKQSEGRRRTASSKSSRRFSSAVESDEESLVTKERTSSRRRSMMV